MICFGKLMRGTIFLRPPISNFICSQAEVFQKPDALLFTKSSFSKIEVFRTVDSCNNLAFLRPSENKDRFGYHNKMRQLEMQKDPSWFFLDLAENLTL